MIKIYQDFLLKNGLKFVIDQKKIPMLTKKLTTLRSNLCDYSDAYIVVKRDITVTVFQKSMV